MISKLFSLEKLVSLPSNGQANQHQLIFIIVRSTSIHYHKNIPLTGHLPRHETNRIASIVDVFLHRKYTYTLDFVNFEFNRNFKFNRKLCSIHLKYVINLCIYSIFRFTRINDLYFASVKEFIINTRLEMMNQIV